MSLFGHGRISIRGTRSSVTLDVQIARTPLARERGLQNVRRLGAREGMLFVFPTEKRWTMWMRNTHIALDMLFADHHGRILTIVHGARPELEQPIAPTVPVRYVLEVPAGFAQRIGVRVGSTIRPA